MSPIPIHRGCFILFMLFLLQNGSSATADNTTKKNVTIEHLPRATVPASYEIKLIPHIIEDNFTFHGESKIVVKVLEETPNVTLHSKNLWIDEDFTRLIDTNGVIRKAKKHSYTEATSFLVIEFNQPITAGEYTLELKYAGNMTAGIYHSSYVNEKGETRWLVASSFRRGKARTAFPCWDEYNLKSTFNLSIKHYPNITAVSNMPIRNEFLDTDGKIWTNFIPTPPMPVYHLGFVASDLNCLRSENNKLSFCGRNEFLPYLKHPLKVTERAIEFLENYIDFTCKWPKFDQFAIPAEDRECGEMKLWESIKYRETDFKKDNMLMATEYGALIVVQEVAGQWIGSLVTLNTMKSSWILEGLSNYLGYYVVDKLFPDWREMDMFVIRKIQYMDYFMGNEVPYGPLERFPDDSSELTQQPQRVYRGGIIFDIMSNILSENTFKEGIHDFVNRNQNRSVNSDDLWNAMQLAYDEHNKKSSGELPIKDVMNSWVQQNGYPIVNVIRDYETGKVIITQEGVVQSFKSNRYWVPINFATKTNPNFERTTPTHWLKPGDESLIIDGIDKDDWIIVNIQQSGYYRVNYDETNWNRIAEYLNTEKYQNIHVRNRAQLIDDLFKMTVFQRQNYTTFLNFVQYLAHEDDYLPWFPTIRAITKLRLISNGWKIDENIKKFFLGLMKKVTEKIDFKDIDKYYEMSSYSTNIDNIDSKPKIPILSEKYFETLHNNDTFFTRRYGNTLKYTACGLGHPSCSESESNQTRAFYSHSLNYEIPMIPGLFYSTFCDEIVVSSEEELLKTMENATSMQYVNYLACSPDETALRKFIAKALNGELNPSEYQMSKALQYFIVKSKNTLNNNVDYVIQHFDAISEYFEKKMGSEKSKVEMNLLLIVSVQVTHTSDQLEKLIDLSKKASNNAELQRAINYKKEDIKWRKDNFSKIMKWFNDHSLHASSALQ